MDFTAELGQDDGFISKCLRSYGKLIGRYPIRWAATSFLVAVVIAVVGFAPRISGEKDLTNPGNLEQLWSVTGSKTQKTVDTYYEKYGKDNKWGGRMTVTMFIAKDGSNKDIATKEAFEEMYGLYEKYHKMSVEVNGKEFSHFDICARGNLVDIPPGVHPQFNATGTPPFPCNIVSPFKCFKEEHPTNAPIWQLFEEMGAIGAPPPNGFGMVPFFDRPSFREMTDKQIKETITKIWRPDDIDSPGKATGCIGHVPEYYYFADLWGGRLEWSGTELTKAGGIRVLFFLDSPERIKYRMSMTRPDVNVDDLDEVHRKLSDKWQEICTEYNKNTKIVEVANMKDWGYMTEEIDKNNEMQWSYFIAGGAIMMCYCAFALISCRHPMASRANLGFAGLFMVLISECTSFGAFFICGLYLNAPMMIGMPLLALGLGVDDMFVLIRYFSNLGVDFISYRNPDDIIGEVLAQAGPGTTLSSVCNILTFTCGAFLPIPAMSDFCICAAFVSFFNYLTMINLFMPFFAMEVARIKRMAPDPHMFTYFCHKRVIVQAKQTGRHSVEATSAENFSKGMEKTFIKFLRQYYAPFVMNIGVRIMTLLVAVGLVVLAIVLINNKSLGYAPQDLFEKGSMEGRAMELTFTTFSLFPSMLIFNELDVANNQAEMLKIFKDVVASEWHIAHLVMPYLGFLPLMGNYFPSTSKYCNVNMTNPAATGPYATTCDLSYMDPAVAPLGLMSPTMFDEAFNQWKTPPGPALEAMYRMPGPMIVWVLQNYMWADTAGTNSFVYKDGKIDWSFFNFFQVFPYKEGRNTEDLFIKSIKDSRDAIDKSPIKDKVSVYGAVTTFWEVFLDLEGYLNMLIAIGAGIIFVVTFVVFSGDIVVGLITAASCAMIVLEVYGFASALMSFNVFIAAITLMGMGLAVEFTAHFAAAYSMGHGDGVVRMGNAMAHTFPAVIEGSISTFCGIIPLTLHPLMFVVKYLFGIIALVVGIGLINGMFIMPGLVALFSPLIDCTDKLRGRGKSLKTDDHGSNNPEQTSKDDAAPPVAAAPAPAVAPAVVEAAPPMVEDNAKKNAVSVTPNGAQVVDADNIDCKITDVMV